MLGNEADALDATQDALLSAVRPSAVSTGAAPSARGSTGSPPTPVSTRLRRRRRRPRGRAWPPTSPRSPTTVSIGRPVRSPDRRRSARCRASDRACSVEPVAPGCRMPAEVPPGGHGSTSTGRPRLAAPVELRTAARAPRRLRPALRGDRRHPGRADRDGAVRASPGAGPPWPTCGSECPADPDRGAGAACPKTDGGNPTGGPVVTTRQQDGKPHTMTHEHLNDEQLSAHLDGEAPDGPVDRVHREPSRPPHRRLRRLPPAPGRLGGVRARAADARSTGVTLGPCRLDRGGGAAVAEGLGRRGDAAGAADRSVATPGHSAGTARRRSGRRGRRGRRPGGGRGCLASALAHSSTPDGVSAAHAPPRSRCHQSAHRRRRPRAPAPVDCRRSRSILGPGPRPTSRHPTCGPTDSRDRVAVAAARPRGHGRRTRHRTTVPTARIAGTTDVDGQSEAACRPPPRCRPPPGLAVRRRRPPTRRHSWPRRPMSHAGSGGGRRRRARASSTAVRPPGSSWSWPDQRCRVLARTPL